MYSFGMFVGGDSPLGASVSSRARTIAVLAAAMLLCVSVAAPLAFAQDPPEDYVPEPGYLDGPGDFGYPRSDDEVGGEQSLCEDDPGAPQCPIPPPYRISRPTASFTSTSVDLSVEYARVTWAPQSSHYYKFELHRSGSATGGYSKWREDWDEATPVEFDAVAVGYYYKVRAKRCRIPMSEPTCGSWGGFSPVLYVPEVATVPVLSRSKAALTASYTAPGRSYDALEVEDRSIGSSAADDDSDESDISGTGHSWSVSRGREYRFRVNRCTDLDRDDCIGWSAWSDWEPVPVLPTPITGSPTLTRSITDLSVSYSASDSSYDKYDLRRAGATAGAFTGYRTRTDNSRKLLGVPRDYRYQVRVHRCTDSALTDCVSASGWSNRLLVPELPRDPGTLTLTRSITDLSVTYSASDSSYDKYDLQRAGATTGSFTGYRDRTANSRKLLGVPRNYRYQVRVYRCTDSALTDCTSASAWSNRLRVPRLPDPPTGLSLSRSRDDVELTYGQSVWTDGTGRYYEFELHQSATEAGRYDEEETDEDSSSPLWFRDVDRGHWYKARGRRCTDSAREDCGSWTRLTSTAIEVPDLPDDPGKPTITVSEDDLTVSYDDDGDSHDQLRFTSSGTESGRFARYTGGRLSGNVLSGVATGRWYKASARRCTDTAHRDCTSWSQYSDAVEVPPALPAEPGKPTLKRRLDDLTVSYTDTGTSFDQFRFKVWDTTAMRYNAYTGGSLSGKVLSDVDRGKRYVVSVRRCADKDHVHCTAWSDDSDAIDVPALPDVPDEVELSVSEDDLTVTYETDDDIDSHDDYTFTTSDTEDGTYTTYSGGTLSGAKLTGVATAKWYKARVRRCLDSKHTECSAWSGYSDAVEVPEPSRFPTLSLSIQSGADGASLRTAFTLTSGYDYALELHTSDDGKRWARHSSVTPAATSSSHWFSGLTNILARPHFRAQLRACATDSTTDCDEWVLSSVITPSKAPAPTVTGITVSNEDDLTIAYTLPTWQHGTGTVYDFKIRRGESSSSSFASDYTDATIPTGSPHKFNDVHTGYYYKALSRRCSDTAKSNCGDWSAVQSGVAVPALSVPPPPTNIRVVAGQSKVNASFGNSSWPGQTEHHYVIELGKSSARTGSYVYGVSPTTQSAGKVSFSGVETGKWYKVRGKRCHLSTGKRCGAWSESPRAEETVVSDPKIEISVFGDSITIGQGLSHNLIVTAKGLDATESYSIVFTTSTQQTAGVLKFGKCTDSDPPDQVEESVGSGRRSSGPVSRRLYACEEGADTLLVSVKLGTRTVALDSIRVTVTALSVPTDLRVSGDSRGSVRGGRALFQFSHEDRSDPLTRYEARYAEALNEAGVEISDYRLSWSDPTPMKGLRDAHPYIDGLSYREIYKVQIRAVRGRLTTDWSEIQFVYPTKIPPTKPPEDSREDTPEDTSEPGGPWEAGIELRGFIKSHIYSYVICEETFPETNRNAWIAAIEAGISQWSRSLPWRTAPSTRIIGHQRMDPTVAQCEPLTDEPPPRDEIHYIEDQELYFKLCRDVRKTSLACSFLPSWKGDQDGFIAFREKSGWHLSGRCSEVFRVAIHESGHSYGLRHSGDFENSVMFRYVRPFCEPQLRDKAAMMAIYQSRER